MPTDTFVPSNSANGTPTLEGANAGRDPWGSLFKSVTQAVAIGQSTYNAIRSSSTQPATPPPGTGARGTTPAILAPTGPTQKYLWYAAIALGAVLVFKVFFKK